MANSYFQFKQFTINQDQCAMKVSTEACILGAWVSANAPQRILDVGTGTGLLALMLAQRYDCLIDAVELDKSTARQARQNIEESPWKTQIYIFEENIFHWTADSNDKYDLIISNPPFFRASLKSESLRSNLAKHESEHFDKLRFIDFLKDALTPDGVAYLLYSEEEAASFTELAVLKDLFVSQGLIIRNQPEKVIFRVVLTVMKNERDIPLHQLIIRNGTEFTPEYRKLLEDYYLK